MAIMSGMPSSEKMLFHEFLEKGQRFCAYRDRSKKEVADKLAQLGAASQILDNVLRSLEKEGFIDEERFAKSFARGKFEYNRWGKQRIRQELILKKVPRKMIELALEQIDESQYLQELEKIALRKFQGLKGHDKFTAIGKTAEHCIRRGFEADLAWDIANKLNNK